MTLLLMLMTGRALKDRLVNEVVIEISRILFHLCEKTITCKLELCLTESLQPGLGKRYCPGPCFLPVNIRIKGGCALFLRGSAENSVHI